jgi:hypothetical protein
MAFKPLGEGVYLKCLKVVGWSLTKGSIDYKLLNENGEFLCAIKVAHGKHTKKEVVAFSIQKTEREFKKRGWPWPPQKKLKNT